MGFHKELRERVNQYFSSNGLPKSAPRIVWFKITIMLSLYVVPFVLAMTIFADSPLGYCLMFLVMGVGMAGIGMNVAHDANHGSVSTNRTVNRFLGSTLYFIGVDKAIWKQEHNVEHHTFTNIEGMDSDISVPSILRFSPHQKLLKIHRVQHIYSWFLYALITLRWATIGDFARHLKNHREKPSPTFWQGIFKLAGWKLFYHAIHWILPVVLLGVSLGTAIISVLLLHLVASTLMGIVFQTAHVMPDSTFPTPDDSNQIDNHWAIHQMETTCNYALNSKIFSWFVGGLNYQIEHHLFPNISHFHYPQLSRIVRETAREHGVVYRTYRTFFDALLARNNFV